MGLGWGNCQLKEVAIAFAHLFYRATNIETKNKNHVYLLRNNKF